MAFPWFPRKIDKNFLVTHATEQLTHSESILRLDWEENLINKRVICGTIKQNLWYVGKEAKTLLFFFGRPSRRARSLPHVYPVHSSTAIQASHAKRRVTQPIKSLLANLCTAWGICTCFWRRSHHFQVYLVSHGTVGAMLRMKSPLIRYYEFWSINCGHVSPSVSSNRQYLFQAVSCCWYSCRTWRKGQWWD